MVYIILLVINLENQIIWPRNPKKVKFKYLRQIMVKMQLSMDLAPHGASAKSQTQCIIVTEASSPAHFILYLTAQGSQMIHSQESW